MTLASKGEVTACVAPALLYLILIVGWPEANSLLSTFTDSSVGHQRHAFVGLQNYHRILTVDEYRDALVRGFVYALLTTIIKTVFGLTVSICIYRNISRFRWLTAVILLPLALPSSICSSLWIWILNDHLGALSLIVYRVFGQSYSFLGSPHLAFITIAGISVWRETPVFILLITTGLRSIPNSVVEASSLDGATGMVFLRYIGFSFAWPYVVASVLLGLVLGFADFAGIYPLTRGGPGNSTQTAVTMAFELGIPGNHLALAYTMIFLMTPFLILMGWSLSRLTMVKETSHVGST